MPVIAEGGWRDGEAHGAPAPVKPAAYSFGWLSIQALLAEFSPEVRAAVSSRLEKTGLWGRCEYQISLFAKAMRNLDEIVGEREVQQFIDAATRPTGSINVNKFLALTMAVVERRQ